MHHKPRIILAYKNFQANRHISHIGLGVAGLNTCKTLLHNGVDCEVWPIIDANDLRKKLNLDRPHHHPITHVVVSAPWIPTHSFHSLCRLFPHVQFAVNCHSNVGFLQADPNGMKLIREGLKLEMQLPNFKMAANSKKMVRWIEDAYGNPCVYLPNLYYLRDGHHHSHHDHHGIIRIGCFGAIRPQKNLASSVAAAIEIGRALKTRTEIWINSGRAEGGGLTVLRTVREMCDRIPLISLHESGWQEWPEFRKLVGSMNLLLQPSYTESFNMVTADGIAEGVPSVVSEAIDWAPHHWRANPDDVFDIARVGLSLLHNRRASHEGLEALQTFVQHGVRAWLKYLE